MKRLPWIRCPTDWVLHTETLPLFKWGEGGGAAHISALMCLTVIVHESDQTTGIARVNYDKFVTATERSRSSVASGLAVLKEMELIESGSTQSEYVQTTFDPKAGWGKFPWKPLYRDDTIRWFSQCHLRSRTELDALKLLYLFVALRDDQSNLATVSYDRITERTKISRQYITRALALLAVNGLVFVQQVRSAENEYAVANTYRLCGVDSHNHRGTRGRAELGSEATEDRPPLSWNRNEEAVTSES